MMVPMEVAAFLTIGRYSTFPGISGNLSERKTKYTVTKNGWDSLQFVPVRTSSLKIKVKLNKDFSSGLYEWIVE